VLGRDFIEGFLASAAAETGFRLHDISHPDFSEDCGIVSDRLLEDAQEGTFGGGE
jgi:hypothetical protein